MESQDMSERVVLCVANAYEEKYFFNEAFKEIPQTIQEELQIMCVLFTREVGGIIILAFESDGTLVLETESDEEDILYDEIGSGLLIKEIQMKKQELLESLNLFYRVFILKESPADVLDS